MLILEDDEGMPAVTCSSIQVSDECYAMVDSGANATIVPQRPDMCGEVADCRVLSAKEG